MRIIAIALALVIIAVACTAPPQDVPRAETPTGTGNVALATDERPIDPEQSTFMFTGYGPGKSHEGTFTDMRGTLKFDGDTIVGASGVINASSVSTGIGGLDNHLKTADFFDVAKYPEIRMESSSIENGQLTGTLTFHGVTKEMTFPVTVEGNTLSGDVIISMKEFGIEFAGANDEVRVSFKLVA